METKDNSHLETRAIVALVTFPFLLTIQRHGRVLAILWSMAGHELWEGVCAAGCCRRRHLRIVRNLSCLLQTQEGHKIMTPKRSIINRRN